MGGIAGERADVKPRRGSTYMCAQVCPIGPAVEQPSNSKVSSCRASMMYDFHTREADWSLREIETFHWHDEDGTLCEGAG